MQVTAFKVSLNNKHYLLFFNLAFSQLLGIIFLKAREKLYYFLFLYEAVVVQTEGGGAVVIFMRRDTLHITSEVQAENRLLRKSWSQNIVFSFDTKFIVYIGGLGDCCPRMNFKNNVFAQDSVSFHYFASWLNSDSCRWLSMSSPH